MSVAASLFFKRLLRRSINQIFQFLPFVAFVTFCQESVPMSNNIEVLSQSKTQRQEFGWGNLTWFANRALGNSDDMTVGRCILKPGHTNGRHYHPNCSETLVVIQGRIKHTATGDGETELSEGDSVVIPPNVRHCATNIGQSDAVLFIAFSSADRQTVGE